MGVDGKLLEDGAAVDVLSNLLGRIVHDFNNPLAAIIGFADLLRNPNLALDKRSRYVERISEQATKMAQLVETMSHFSGGTALDIGSVALGKAVRETCSLLEPGLTGARIELRLADVVQECVVAAERRALGRILHVLLTNAEQVFRENPLLPERTVWVEMGALADGAYVDVTDSGTGVPADLDATIFEPFFSTRRSGGLGLGLAIGRSLAEQMGGSLELRAEHDKPGGGACFRLILPLAKER